MFIVSADVNTAPAMPTCDGNLISVISGPAATLENSVFVGWSYRKIVARSALSIWVVSATTRCSNKERSTSALISETTSRNDISLVWMRFIRSLSSLLRNEIDACWAIAPSRSRSRSVKVASILFKLCMTPMVSPAMVFTGTQMIPRVLYPVYSSTLRLKRSSS
ncbi:MAG: Uncharacterised protein [Hyphomonas sp. TMED17]|nr:MAG: Uncharacterised protein [Hyphomonas sp. TMED17]